MIKRTVLAGSFLILLAGCAAMRANSNDFPMHVYEQPLDLVYMKVYDTVAGTEGWVMYRTDKTNGIIEARNTIYGNWFDIDLQQLRFIVKMVSRTETSVAFDPVFAKCKGNTCLHITNKVHDVLNHLPARPKPQAQQPAP